MKITYLLLIIVAIIFCIFGFLGHISGFAAAALCFFAATMLVVGKRNKYTISIKNVHMYCYMLTIKDDKNTYEAIIEAAPTKQKTMIIWLKDFNFPKNEIESIKKEIVKFFALKNTDCILKSGKRV